MKILLAHFQIQDFGGIVNYSEYLARGFKELGYEVDCLMLKNKGVSGIPKTKDRSLDDGWEFGEGLGLWMHQKSGWEGMYQLNYASNLTIWEDICDDYDLIIYVVPVPTCTKATKGDDKWLRLFDVPLGQQLAIVHDGNMQKLYPHIIKICNKIDGIICVHDAAYNSCEVLPVPRTFIPNPHDISPPYIVEMDEREDGFVSLQTFKRWKRVDDLIRAIPFMDGFTEKNICGGGIEYCYMTSKTKCKAEYHDEKGNRIWDNAINNGMKFLGYVTTEERDFLLQNNKLLIDPSWSKKYSELGCHFNRVMVEAMAHGCVPVCTDLAMRDSMLFQADVNYIEIPFDIEPCGYADIIDDNLANTKKLQRMQEVNLKLVAQFDKRIIATRIIDFSADPTLKIGKVTEEIIMAANKKMNHFEDF